MTGDHARRPAGAAVLPGSFAPTDPDSALVTEAHRGLIRSKSFLRRIYLEHYRFFADEIASVPPGAIIELGSGGGFAGDIIPGIVTTDVVPLSTIQAVLSAVQLPFRDRSVSALVMINVLHHIQDVERFFSEAARCLVPGGKIVMVEPANTRFSRFFYTRLHHEPFDPGMEGWRLPAGGRLSAANDALPSIIFERDAALFRERFPELTIERYEPTLPFSYIISGGVSRWALLPGCAYNFVRTLERSFGSLNACCGMFVKIVLRRTNIVRAGFTKPGVGVTT